MAGQPPEFGRPGQRRGQPAGDEVGEGALAVGDAGEEADHSRGDPQGRQCGRRIRAIGGVGVLARAEPVHHVGDAEADGEGEGHGGEASAESQAVVERVRAPSCPAEQCAAEARGAEAPGRLTQPTSERVLGARRKGPEHGEPERHRGAVDRDRAGTLRGRGRRSGGEGACRCLQRVLRPGREQVMQPGGQTAHEALVERAARGERGREGARGHGRGDDQPDVRSGARRPGVLCPAPACRRSSGRSHGGIVRRTPGQRFILRV